MWKTPSRSAQGYHWTPWIENLCSFLYGVIRDLSPSPSNVDRLSLDEKRAHVTSKEFCMYKY